MQWYWVSIITLTVYWVIGCIVCGVTDNDEYLQYMSLGLVYLVLFVVCYPIRAWKRYSYSCDYYQKHGITRIQYLFGKRVKHEDT